MPIHFESKAKVYGSQDQNVPLLEKYKLNVPICYLFTDFGVGFMFSTEMLGKYASLQTISHIVFPIVLSTITTWLNKHVMQCDGIKEAAAQQRRRPSQMPQSLKTLASL